MTIWVMATERAQRSSVEEGAPQVEGVEFLGAAEWQAMLEEIAQRDFGTSLAKFSRAYWAGELDPCESRVARLAVLLPERTL